MTPGADRRSVLAGLGALGLAGCGRVSDAKAGPAALEAIDLSALEARHGGRLGLSALDTGSSRRVAWRGDERFATCSSFKLFLSAMVLEACRRQGADALQQPVPIRRSDILDHSPLTEPHVGATMPVEDLCAAAVLESDNAAANLLFGRFGGPVALTAFYRSLGDQVSRSDRIEMALNSAVAGDPRDTASPNASVGNLQTLILGDRLHVEDRARLQRWLVASGPGAARIKAAVPPAWRVGHKTGTGANGATIDIGVLWPTNAAPIVMAVYFTEAPDAPLAARERVIADAARAAREALGHD